MTSDLLTLFGRMFPDYSHPALVENAEESVLNAELPQGQMMRSVEFADILNFRDGFYKSIEGQTCSRLFPRLGSSGWMAHGHFLTLNILVSHSADAAYSVCSLKDILEQNVAQKYFLSKRACLGILLRAEKRGKKLPETLGRSLRIVAGLIAPQETGTS